MLHTRAEETRFFSKEN